MPDYFEKKVEIAWTDIFVAGLGGGAIHEVADQFIGRMLPPTAAVAGITLKDIALIALGKYGAERTDGHIRTALKGMAIIGVYKVVYPQFIRPIVSGLVGAAPAGTGSSPATSAEAAANAKYGWS